MAATPVALQADTGETVIVFLEATATATGTPNGSGYSATEKSTALGWYDITITEALLGVFFWHAENAGGAVLSNGIVYLDDTTTQYFGHNPGDFFHLYSILQGLGPLIITNTSLISANAAAIAANAAAITVVDGNVDTLLTNLSSVDGKIDAIDGNVDGIVTSIMIIDGNVIISRDQAIIAAANTQR